MIGRSDIRSAWSAQGVLAFGIVIGYVTYRTIRRTKATGLSDIAAVIGAVGGSTVTLLKFPAGSQAFGAYGIGLAAGFFIYLFTALFVAKGTGGLTTSTEWLGEPSVRARPDTSGRQTEGTPPIPDRQEYSISKSVHGRDEGT